MSLWTLTHRARGVVWAPGLAAGAILWLLQGQHCQGHPERCPPACFSQQLASCPHLVSDVFNFAIFSGGCGGDLAHLFRPPPPPSPLPWQC